MATLQRHTASDLCGPTEVGRQQPCCDNQLEAMVATAQARIDHLTQSTTAQDQTRQRVFALSTPSTC